MASSGSSTMTSTIIPTAANVSTAISSTGTISTTATVPTTEAIFTTTGASGAIPTETVIAITASLGGVMFVLVAILLCLHCRRNRFRQDITASVKPIRSPTKPSSANHHTHTNAAFSHVDETAAPQTRRPPPTATSQRESTGSTYMDMGGVTRPPATEIAHPHGDSTRQHDALVGSAADSDASAYVNIAADIHDGRQPPKPPHARSNGLEPPALPQRKASVESVESPANGHNLFRRGTKAYHLYMNAVQDYEMEPGDLRVKEKLGKGHFGYVCVAIAARLPHSTDTDRPVAVKTMRGAATDSDKQEFLYEYEIMKLTNTLKHPNITRLLGSVTKSQPCMIVLELMSNGNLRKFLRDTRSQDVYYNLHGNSDRLPERQLLQFALDIANGMEGIADLQLLHRDLAARNILLDENLTCKIADFGFAKDVLNKPQYKSKSVFQRPRPTRWLAPESLFLFNHSILSDVWSYGVVLWEIVTLGNLPYPNMKTAPQVSEAISQGYRMPCPKHCSADIYRVMSCCWAEKPNNRPSFPQLVDKMRQLLDKATFMLDMERLEEDADYIEVLPPDDQEIHKHYHSQETLG